MRKLQKMMGVGMAVLLAGTMGMGTIQSASAAELTPDHSIAQESGSAIAAENALLRSVSYPYGGVWQYGTTQWNGGGDVYSNYLHYSRNHHASVRNACGYTDYRWARSGGWARARTFAVAFATDQAFFGLD